MERQFQLLQMRTVATIEDAAFSKSGYALDPNADRFTFGVWQFLKTDHSTGAKQTLITMLLLQ